MITGATDRVSIIGRLIARWEVSRLAVLPTSFTMLSAPLMASGLYGLSKGAGRAGLLIGSFVGAVWFIAVLLEYGRAIWSLRHPYASASWLRSLRAAAGDRVVDQALAYLAMQHALTSGYVIRRYDMAVAIWVQRDARRDARRQAEGLRLDQVFLGS